MRFSAGRPGVSGLLKKGFKHFSGVEEAIMRNIEAAKKLSDITKTSLGPNGMKKLVRLRAVQHCWVESYRAGGGGVAG